MSSSTARSEPLLEVRGIVKRFGGATALGGVDLTVYPGEVLGLLGANGAGKSTLIKILAGLHRQDGGEIRWQGELLSPRSTHDSEAAGIAVMFQQLNVVEDLTVGEYLSLGRERARLGVIRRRSTDKIAADALAAIGVDLPLRRSARTLSAAERELVEIARAVSMNARLVIMDEPSASLGEHEVERLLTVIRQLKAHGVAVVYVSHKLDEVIEITDRSTVLRDGMNAGELRTADTDKDAILRLMVGDRAYKMSPRERSIKTDPVLVLTDVTTAAGINNVSLSVHRGEIVGVYGLMGSGRTELLRACYGIDPIVSGSMTLNGRPFRPRTPRAAVRSGIGLVPEDRVREAMIRDASVAANLTIGAGRRIVRGGMFRDRHREDRLAADVVTTVGIKVPSISAPIGSLSGGNQQKVIFGRWILAESDLLLLDDPTVGVDVAAKADIYQIVRDLTDRGASVLICSSELEELLILADRIAVLHHGAVVDIVDPAAADAAVVIRQSIVGTESELPTELK